MLTIHLKSGKVREYCKVNIGKETIMKAMTNGEWLNFEDGLGNTEIFRTSDICYVSVDNNVKNLSTDQFPTLKSLEQQAIKDNSLKKRVLP